MAVSDILGITLVAPTQTDKTTTMNDMIVAIEDATQEQLAVSMAGGNVTLTGTQFTRNAVFVVSGLTTGRNLVVPLTKRVFVVRNSSAFDCTVKGASGTTVVVAGGDGAIIQCDGTNCVSLAAGGAGAAGPTGLPGGAVTIAYTFSPTVTNADPGAGVIRLNNITQNTATAIYLDLLDANGADWTTVIDSLDDSTSTVKGRLRLFNRSDDSKWILFTLSALVSHTGYRELTVAVVASSAASPFSSSDDVMLSFDQTGNVGATGSTGATGATGAAGSSRTKGVMLAQWVLGTVAANGAFYFAYKAPYAGTITSLDSLSSTGTFTLAVKINGTNVTSLSAVAVSTAANTLATGANTFSAGDTITGTISSAAGSPTDAVLSLNATWV